MSQIKVTHGSATVTLEPVIDQSTIVDDVEGTLVRHDQAVMYSLPDLITAYSIARKAAQMAMPQPEETP